MLFNKSLQLGTFPGNWKLANIVPIFMKGKRDLEEDYCRISPSLPVISKVLERCVLAVVRDHVSSLISREQHRFLAGRSCVTQLTGVLRYIAGQLDAGKQIHMKYLNVSKAYSYLLRITPRYLEGCIKTTLPANFTICSVHTYRLLFSKPLPENCRLHPGYHKGPY